MGAILFRCIRDDILTSYWYSEENKKCAEILVGIHYLRVFFVAIVVWFKNEKFSIE